MKLIYLSHWRFPSTKTMSPLVMKTCYHFAKKGYEVELWIPTRFNKEETEDPFTYHNIPQKNFKIKKVPSLDVSSLGSIGFIVMLLSYAFFVSARSVFNGDYKNAFFYAHDIRDAVFLSFISKNIFLEVHDFYLSNIFFFNRAVNKAKGIVVTNKIKIDKLTKEFNISRNNMLHKPNAVDIKQFDIEVDKLSAREKLNLPTDKKIVLYTGHLFSWKGVNTLLDSHKLFGEKERIYFVGGAPEDVGPFEKKRLSMGAHNVEVVGMRPHEEVPLWLKAADVLVLPNTAKEDISKYETSPVKLFEYMASSVPIVSSDLPSIRNVVDDDMVWFFESDNSEDLYKVIQRVFKMDDEVKNKVNIAKLAVKDYTWETRIGDISDFIKRTKHENK
jgi:glycosyltransferase involved in cell wall biosynthesis